MISFKQMCELLTHGQTYSWFWIDEAYTGPMNNQLTDEEIAMCHWERQEYSLLRVWYPKERFNEEKSKQEEYLARKAKEDYQSLVTEVFPDNLPTMKQLLEQRIAASMKDDLSAIRIIDKQIKMRARKDVIG